MLKINCSVIQDTIQQIHTRREMPVGYSASIAVTDAEDRLISHGIQTARTIDALAHDIAIQVDAKVIEGMRRTAEPSSSPSRYN
jgi:hypothetical protein